MYLVSTFSGGLWQDLRYFDSFEEAVICRERFAVYFQDVVIIYGVTGEILAEGGNKVCM